MSREMTYTSRSMQLNIDCRPADIADGMDARGVVCLPNAVSEDWLAEARDEVRRYLAEHGERNSLVRSPSTPALAEMISDSRVLRLLTDIIRTRLPEAKADAELLDGAVRIIAGPHEEGDAWWFHYDASAITVIVPIFIPDAGRGTSGELVGLFNRRPFRRFAISNVVGKAFSQSGFYRRRLLRRVGKPGFGQVVDMTPGDMYLLWGYRSLHANMPCRSGALRVTLLMHFGRMHPGSRVMSAAVRAQDMMRTG
ncbi:hypothetical protein [Mycolicibacterium phlei]|uniref:hypothetical protein n=1 Tax=Mycolicibacterium phlei TaxID=1771 RepID=UPI000F81E76D|nr:hypothetical protein [Mycolicibacterium phlei]